MPAMCIAIPPPTRSAGPGHGAWAWLSARADRLMALAALLQAGMLALATPAPPGLWLLPPASLVLGLAMQSLPARLNSLPIAYPQRTLVFAALAGGGLLASSDSAAVVAGGIALLGMGWLWALRSLRWKLHWSRGRPGWSLHAGFAATTLTGAVMLGVLATGLLLPV